MEKKCGVDRETMQSTNENENQETKNKNHRQASPNCRKTGAQTKKRAMTKKKQKLMSQNSFNPFVNYGECNLPVLEKTILFHQADTLSMKMFFQIAA